MKKNMLLIVLMVFFVGCETGTRYDRNATEQIVPKAVPQSGVVNRADIEALLDDREMEVPLPYDEEDLVVKEFIEPTTDKVYEEIKSFSSGVITDGLDIRKIREGKHDGYIRLVFDVYNDLNPAKKVGQYEAQYSNSKKEITVILNGYRKFSALLPSFSNNSIIEKIYFDQYLDDSGFKFYIKLRENAEVKIFDLKNPARIVFDIKSI
ncbi:MAG: Unknown protein [uncultured Sulfurovum sp.]|uniref:AMIN domain-containing protein n=1 Tax=uncultured Sulfurovum sp. TaxID=269237 RepID=A0A6S6TDS7_9BACT|nr:MAG: Unknown protein [uncultured Sulfurovum sp.]